MTKCPLKHETTKSHYPVIIIGGGIVGAGIYRDLSLQNVPCLLIDKKDFASQTSTSSSKMLHGGIRYLENLDFSLVWEALHEKNLWLRLAPHLCYESPFYIPVYKDSMRPLWMIRIGLFLYDILSFFKNSPYKILNKENTLKALPGISDHNLKGSGMYYDAIVDDCKLNLEVIYDGSLSKGSKALNYVELINFKNSIDQIECFLKDELTGDERRITCDELIFAVGPFTDQMLKKNSYMNWNPILMPSKGSHLWLKKNALDIQGPMVITPKDGRVIFVIPQGDKILLGTTESKIEGKYFDIKPSQEEIDYLLSCVNEYFPSRPIDRSHILSSFAGIRPLVKEGSSRGKTARKHKVFNPMGNISVIVGGKLTTFRTMAQDVLKTTLKRLNRGYDKNKTKSQLRQKSIAPSFSEVVVTKEMISNIIDNEYVRTVDDVFIRRLGIYNESYWKQEESYQEMKEYCQKLLNNK
jgi:glycerol-3-phosphate dehydrogenase